MDRFDLVTALTDRVGLSRAQAAACLDTISDVLTEAVRERQQVKIGRLMTVSTVERAQRPGRNPRTGEPITIPARTGVKITPGSVLTGAARS